MSRPRRVGELLPRLRQVARRFRPYLGRHRLLIGGSFVALVAEVLLRLVEPWMLALVLDHVILSQQSAPLGLPVLRELAPMTLLAVASVGLVVAVGLRALSVYLSTVGFALVGNRVLTEVRGDLYRHLHRLSLSFHSHARGGDLTVRVIGDVGLLRDVVVTAALPMAGNMLTLLGMLVVLFLLQWQLALLSLLCVPLFWLTTLRLTNQIHTVSREQRKREGSMASAAAESLGAIRDVQALSLEQRMAGTFARQNRSSLKEGVKGARLAARLGRTVDLLIAVSTALVLYFGARFVLAGELTAGALVVFITYLKNALRPVRDFARYSGRLAKATAAGERILDVFEREPDVVDRPDAVPAPRLLGGVRFEAVSFGYEPGRPALHHVDLEVAPGQCVAVVGASGSGKSTLLNLVLRLYDPQEGRLLLDGRDVRDYTLESVRTQIGVVLQDTVLFAASVRENIAYGAPEATDEEIEAAARLANAHDFVRDLPQGYDTVLGERGVTLSGGQRQRVAIARAAVRRAPILVLDEPVTGLDADNAAQVTDALARIAAGHTTFLATHDLERAAQSDLVLLLEHGRVVEQGPPERLLRAARRRPTMTL